MKVCRKCKKKVANKSKICKYCGADVSKAKIIKNSNNKRTTPKKNNKNKVKKIEPKVQVVEEKVKDVTEVKEEKKVETVLKDDTKIVDNLLNLEKTIEKDEPIKKSLKEKIRNVLISIKLKIKSRKSLSGKSSVKSKLHNKYNYVKDKLRQKRLNRKNKPDEEKLLFKFKQKLIERKEKKLVKKEEKAKAKEQKLKEKEKKKKLELKKKENSIKEAALEKEKEALEKTKEIINANKKKINNSKIGKSKKIRVIIKLLIILLLMGLIVGISLYFLSSNTPKEIVQIRGEKATNDKLFALGDIINYNGVSYKVANVELSDGNSFSSPKEGSIYVIITLYIINNTEHQIDYSYNSWILSDNKNKKDKQVFSSINVEDALYSGKLNAGLTKRGSIIYEVSKKASDIRLSYYDVIINQDKEETIDYSKKIFSVNIELPKIEKKSKKK